MNITQRIKRSTLLCAALAVMSTMGTGCGNWIDPGLNVDPNNPPDVTMNLLLPTVEVGLGYAAGGDLSRFAGLAVRQYAGTDRQFSSFELYQYVESDFTALWANMYAGQAGGGLNGGALINAAIMMQKANDLKSPHYRGVGRVLTALALGLSTDTWGDIPYSEALRGVDNLAPKYDSQQTIYTTIQNLLDSAIIDLSASSSNFRPGADDIIYGGDRNAWIKAAKTLKARYWLHLTKVDNTAASKALAALSGGIASNNDNMMLTFGSAVTANSPLYQFLQQRSGYLSMGAQIVKMMNDLNDPRRAAFIELDGDGKYSENSTPGPLYGSDASAVPLVTYAEAKFIEAEAQLRAGKTAEAKTAYTAAINASMAHAGVSSDNAKAYLAQSKVMPAGDLTLQTIIEQKYIALFSQPEAWTDWRRTGFPAVQSTTGVPSQIPRRLLYPQSERNYNPNTPTGVNLTTRLWWDK
jgi:hypothetical protein